ncbi:MAG TPA: hypothetical protein VFS90_17465 [Pyrinomonadaceae bacterium]|nr:hypothetical protein [Pyrinomonadaceae bacterium]
MEPKYRIRVQAIVTADDDGSHAANITPADLKTKLEFVNTVFAAANIEFVFNEQLDFFKMRSTVHNRNLTVLEPPNVDGDKWDHKPEVDELSHERARNELAKQFGGRLVLIIHYREKIKKVGGQWVLLSGEDGAGGSGGPTDFFLEMSPDLNGPSLCHELGHYLQLPHTFAADPPGTVKKAATMIRKYVEDEGHDKKDGLDALDGDRAVLLDTPADVGSAIWKDLDLDKCGRVGQISIPVKFTDGSEKEYTLEPDRGNPMSYFKGCDNTKIFSPQQIRRMRDSLELRLRHYLISMRPSSLHQIVRGGMKLAGAIEDVDMALVRAGRVVTAVRLTDNRLKMIVWDINEDATEVTRREDAVAGDIGDFAICSLGSNMVATAVSTDNVLKVIVWRVDENGAIVAVDNVKNKIVIKNTAISIIKYGHGANFFATASHRFDNRLEVDVWEVRATGSLIHKVNDTFETGVLFPVGNDVTTPLAMSNVGIDAVACHHLDDNKNFTTFLWAYDQGGKKIVQRAKLANVDAKIVRSCSPARDLAIAATRDANNKLKLIAFHFPGDGKWMERVGDTDAGEIANIDVCPMGTEMFVTGHRRGEGSDRLKLILWQVTKSGNGIIRLTEATTNEDEEFSRLSMCQTGRNQFATAMRGTDGNLRVIAWRVREPIAPLPSGSTGKAPVNVPGVPGPRPKPVNRELEEDCDAKDI